MTKEYEIRVQVIASALLGKYNDWDYRELTLFVSNVQQANFPVSHNEENYNNRVLITDIERHLYLFNIINTKWIHDPLDINLLCNINMISRGTDSIDKLYRTEKYVEDFGGNALTPPEDIKDELVTLSSLLELANHSIDKQKIDHASLMAKLFFEIIRIHPFTDANGRTARFLIQLLAKKWGYQYFIIPKYRNDKDWKSALDRAKSNDRSAMTNYIFNRLIPL